MKSDAIARRWIEAFNHHDVAALVGLYAEDAVHISPKLRAAKPETRGRITGKAALTEWWLSAFRSLPGLHYQLTRVTAAEDRVWIEYLRQLPGEEPLAVAEVFQLRNGLIATSSVYHG